MMCQKTADVEAFRHALAGEQTALAQNCVVHVKAVHRQHFRGFSPRSQRIGEILRHGRLAGAGRTGDGDQGSGPRCRRRG